MSTAPLQPTGALLMDADEARATARQIQLAVGGLRALIADFDEREGWRALGYASFRAWSLAEIDATSLRHIYRLRDAADVDRSLGVTIGHTPESHARELKPVPPEQRPAVLAKAAARAGDRPVQASDIRAVAQPAADFADLQQRAQRVGASLTFDGEYIIARPGQSDVRTADVTRLRAWLAEREQALAAPAGDPAPDELRADLARLGWRVLSRRDDPKRGALFTVRTPDGQERELSHYRLVEAIEVAIEALPDEPILRTPDVDPIPIDVRVEAAAYGLLSRPATEPGGFYLYWPGEEDEVDNFMPFDAESARDWLLNEACYQATRVPDSLYNRALRAGWCIVGAHAEGPLIVQPTSDATNTVTEELTPAELEARIAGDGRSIDGLPHPPLDEPPLQLHSPSAGEPGYRAPDPQAIIPAAQRVAEASAGLLEANRENPAWQVGATWQDASDPVGALLAAGELSWLSGETRAAAAQRIKRAVAQLPEPVARLLLLATAISGEERGGALSYHRTLVDGAVTGAIIRAAASGDRECDLLAMLLDTAGSEATT